jgi:hypothetical protein
MLSDPSAMRKHASGASMTIGGERRPSLSHTS